MFSSLKWCHREWTLQNQFHSLWDENYLWICSFWWWCCAASVHASTVWLTNSTRSSYALGNYLSYDMYLQHFSFCKTTKAAVACNSLEIPPTSQLQGRGVRSIASAIQKSTFKIYPRQNSRLIFCLPTRTLVQSILMSSFAILEQLVIWSLCYHL
jgi:hypothetical protein